MGNLTLAWRKARKGKTKKIYVKIFEKDIEKNLIALHYALKFQSYEPKPLKTFILRDPKTRKISKAEFSDRIVHHALCNIISPIFNKTFIYDSCANQKCKGTLFAIRRFDKFQRKVTNNLTSSGYCLKADIRHYFFEVDNNILLDLIKSKIKDEKVIWLITKILLTLNSESEKLSLSLKKGMPLGNLTSQLFANIYLNKLDHFVKHQLKAKYYIRYVDDFVLLHESNEQLEKWRNEIDNFLNTKLKLELHPDKSKIIPLSKGIDFVGFRNFYKFRLIRKRNIRNMLRKTELFAEQEISYGKIIESFQGWNAYAKWANAYMLRRKILVKIADIGCSAKS
jgi:retron-type reverse transcriptase